MSRPRCDEVRQTNNRIEMQSATLMNSTLEEQHQALTEVCKIGQVMLLSDFDKSFDHAVEMLFSPFGDLVGQDLMADVITRAQRHDIRRRNASNTLTQHCVKE